MDGILIGFGALFFGVSAGLFRLGLFYLEHRRNDRGMFLYAIVCLVLGSGLLGLGVGVSV